MVAGGLRVRRRDTDPQAGATQRTRRDGDLALVGDGDLPNDRQTQAGTTGVVVPGLVDPCETVEYPLRFVRGNPGPVVVDVDDRYSVAAAKRDDDFGVGVLGGVVDEVSDRPRQEEGTIAAHNEPAR